MTPAKLVASLPETIRVGPFDMRIIRMDAPHSGAAEAFGYFRKSEEVIALEACPSGSCVGLADTFVHEINHAVYWAYGLKDDDAEERTASTMSTAWVQVYRDNPWLLDWLKKALK